MIVYKSRRFATRRYQYGGSGIVSMIGSLLAQYATKAMPATAAKTALGGSLDAAKRAVTLDCTYKRETQSRGSVEESIRGYRWC